MERGLTGRWSVEQRPGGEGEYRSGESQPRYAEANFAANLGLVEVVKRVAARRGAEPAQVALAWVLGRGEDVVSIPGTTKARHLDSNVSALDVELDAADLAELDRLATQVQGERYNEMGMRAIEG